MKLHCNQCGRPIPAEDIHLENQIAKCRACGSVFSIAHALQESVNCPREPNRPGLETDCPRPAKLRVEDDGVTLRFRRRWFSWKVLPLIPFAIFWDAFLVVLYGGALTGPNTPCIVLVLPLGHLAVGLFLSYFVLCSLFNRTTVELTAERLLVRHCPLPWRGNRTVDTSEIDQLYCKGVARQGKSSVSVTYELHLLRTNKTKIKLLTGR